MVDISLNQRETFKPYLPQVITRAISEQIKLDVYSISWWAGPTGNQYSHVLGELGRLVVHVGHADTDRRRPCARHLPFIHRHDDKLIDVVRSLVVQCPPWEDGAVGGDAEVGTQGVVCQLSIQV